MLCVSILSQTVACVHKSVQPLGDLSAYATNRFAALHTDVTALCMPVAEPGIVPSNVSLLLGRCCLLAFH